jgi:hypothetical protein
MSQMTVDLPEELVTRLQPYAEYIPQILELGLRQFDPERTGIDNDVFVELDSIVNFLHHSPAPAEIIALRPSKALQVRISSLLEKNRQEGMTEIEETWWERFEYVEHLVRIAKAKAFAELQA